MFGRIGPMELVLVLTIALIIFGPSKLPEIGKSIGRAINEFKSQANSITKDLDISDINEQSKSGSTGSGSAENTAAAGGSADTGAGAGSGAGRTGESSENAENAEHGRET